MNCRCNFITITCQCKSAVAVCFSCIVMISRAHSYRRRPEIQNANLADNRIALGTWLVLFAQSTQQYKLRFVKPSRRCAK